MKSRIENEEGGPRPTRSSSQQERERQRERDRQRERERQRQRQRQRQIERKGVSQTRIGRAQRREKKQGSELRAHTELRKFT